MPVEWAQLELLAIDTIQACAPEMRATPIRFFATEDIPIFRSERNCIGFTQSELDRVVLPYLIDPPAPAGRFFAVAYSRAKCLEAYGLEDERFNYRFVALALHEAAHLIEFDVAALHALRPLPPSAILSDARRIAAAGERDLTTMTKGERADFAAEQLHLHGAEFTRIALHLLWRAKHLHGFSRLTAGLVVDYAAGRSHPDAYLDAIGDEPSRCRYWTFERIRETPAPPKFNELWKRDLDAAIARHTKETEMGITDALAKIETKQQTAAAQERDRAQAAEAAYQKILTRVLAGQNVDDVELEKVITAAGRSTKEVREAIFQQQRISNLRETVAAAETVPAAMRAIAIDRKAADDKLEVARVQHAREVNAIAIRSAQCDDIIVQASNARSELRRLTGPEDHNRLAEIGREGLRLTERIRVIRELRDRNEVMHKANVETAKRNGRPLDINDEQEYARRHPHSPLAGVLDCRAELDLLSEQMNALAEERQSIERRIAS